jgi:transposase
MESFGPLIPKPKRRNDGRGRPWKSRRSVLNGILWVLRTGAPWADLPEACPSFQTCHRRFQQWGRSGVMNGNSGGTCFRAEAQTCYRRTGGFHRRDLCAGEKGGLKVGKTKRGKGTKIMAVADRHGLPVPICIESATPHEVKLATSTLVQMVVHDAPRNLIGDNAYDSDKLDDELRCYGIEVIARTGVTEKLRHKTNAVCGDTVDAGKSRDYLPGCRTFGASLSDMSVTLKTSSECFTLLAASFC